MRVDVKRSRTNGLRSDRPPGIEYTRIAETQHRWSDQYVQNASLGYVSLQESEATAWKTPQIFVPGYFSQLYRPKAYSVASVKKIPR